MLKAICFARAGTPRLRTTQLPWASTTLTAGMHGLAHRGYDAHLAYLLLQRIWKWNHPVLLGVS
eukprot:156916-Pelagomonas_calceolata.AAC.1